MNIPSLDFFSLEFGKGVSWNNFLLFGYKVTNQYVECPVLSLAPLGLKPKPN